MSRTRDALAGFFSPPAERGERIVMARALGALFIAGALIGLVSLALPHWRGANLLGIALVCTVAIGVGAGLLVGERRLPAWTLPGACYGAIFLIAAAIYLSDRPASPYAFYFVLVAMFSAYFLSVAQLVLQTLLIAAVYPLVVAAIGDADWPAQRWLLTIWTVVVVGAFIATLRRRVDGLIEKLSDAALTDPLTKLLNRRGFQEAFDLELERSRRTGRPCALLIADLDHFKRVNDLLGHPAGDERLVKLARLLEAGKRRIDAAARMGGEEFALLLPDTDEHGAFVIAERLRHTVRDAFAPDELALTVSFGVASYPRQGATGNQLLVAADQALYVAKELGRDRTAIYRPEVSAKIIGERERAADRAEGFLSAVLVLAEAVDLRDGGSVAHSETVGRLAEMMAIELGLEEEHVERIRLAGILHDIGKVAVPDEILQKAGPLDESEWTEMRRHPDLGARLLSGAGVDDVAFWVLTHHERPDGGGYPAGLRGAEIPPEARILAVADAYESMVVDRCYRPSLTRDEARFELRAGAGSQFDELVVEALVRCLDRSEEALAL